MTPGQLSDLADRCDLPWVMPYSDVDDDEIYYVDAQGRMVSVLHGTETSNVAMPEEHHREYLLAAVNAVPALLEERAELLAAAKQMVADYYKSKWTAAIDELKAAIAAAESRELP